MLFEINIILKPIIFLLVVIGVKKFYSIKFENKKTKFKESTILEITIYFGYCIYLIFAMNFDLAISLNIIHNVLFLTLPLFIYKSSILYKIKTLILSSAFVFSIIFVYYFINSIIAKSILVVALCALIISFKNTKSIKTQSSSTENAYIEKVIFAIVPIFSAISMILIAITLVSTDSSLSIFFTRSMIIILIINFLYFVVCFKFISLHKIKTDNLLMKAQIENYSTYYNQLQTLIEENNIIKHNLKHELIHLVSQVQKNNYDAVEEKQLITKLLDDIFTCEYVNFTDNHSIDMLLNYEINKAKKLGIKINTKIALYDEIIINSKSITVILGNILDNAITACEKGGDKTISLSLIQQSSNLYISTKNKLSKNLSFEDDLPLSTKDNDAELKGFGLKSVRKIVEENNGVLNINANDGIFKLEILLNNN